MNAAQKILGLSGELKKEARFLQENKITFEEFREFLLEFMELLKAVAMNGHNENSEKGVSLCC